MTAQSHRQVDNNDSTKDSQVQPPLPDLLIVRNDMIKIYKGTQVVGPLDQGREKEFLSGLDEALKHLSLLEGEEAW